MLLFVFGVLVSLISASGSVIEIVKLVSYKSHERVDLRVGVKRQIVVIKTSTIEIVFGVVCVSLFIRDKWRNILHRLLKWFYDLSKRGQELVVHVKFDHRGQVLHLNSWSNPMTIQTQLSLVRSLHLCQERLVELGLWLFLFSLSFDHPWARTGFHWQ